MIRLFRSLLLILFLCLIAALPAVGSPIPLETETFTGCITYAEAGNPFGVNQGETFNWTATYPENIIGDVEISYWGNPNFALNITIGSYNFTADDDVHLAYGYPKFIFTDGELTGLDVWEDSFSIGSILYAFTTNTPLPTAGGFNPDFSTFSIFEYTDDGAKAVVSGNLFCSACPSAVPIPAPILLLGTGLVGLVGFRRKTH